jgi:hypothetical protein
MTSRRSTGQATVEALVVAVILAAALLVPWLDGDSPAALLADAFAGASQGFFYWLAVI